MSTTQQLQQTLNLHRSGDLKQAESAYREIIDREPENADALHLLGVVLHQRDQNDEAVELIQRAIAIKPDNASFHTNLGAAFRAADKTDQARAAYQRALKLDPRNAKAHNNLGNLLKELDEPLPAIQHYRQAIRIDPDFAEAYHNLGSILADRDRLDEAIECFHRALCLKPNYADAHNGLGKALRQQGKHQQALARYEQALQIKPDYAEAYNNQGVALQSLCQLPQAIAAYDKAIELNADYVEAHVNRSLARLLLGDYSRGLEEYEWRWKRPESPAREFSKPPWTGEDLDGQTLLLHAEQGLGDTLQFIRYAALAKQRGARIVVACQPTLVPLLSRCEYIDELANNEAGKLPPFDLHAPLVSLPWLFGTTLETIPADVPYLTADPDLVEHWRPKIEAAGGFRIGIHWQGNSTYGMDRFRSMPLDQFAPLAAIPGVRLISLQKGPAAAQLDRVRFPVTRLPDDFDEPRGAFTDTAAVLAHLDLVIGCDSAINHLAGALAVPVWVALQYAPNWRWHLDRSNSPWYPTMTLLRQPSPGRWPPVFQAAAAQLRRTLGEEELGVGGEDRGARD